MRRHPAEKPIESLIYAIEHGGATNSVVDAYVKALLDMKPPCPDEYLLPLFRVVLSNKDNYALQKLLPLIRSERSWTFCLILAINFQNSSAKELLINAYNSKYDLHISMEQLDGKTILSSALEHGDLKTVKWLNTQRTNIVGQLYAENRTPLHIASGIGQLALVEFLVKEGAQICSYDASDASPLVCALNNGHKSIALHLLQQGAGLFERFQQKHVDTLKSFQLDESFFLGATLKGEPLPKDLLTVQVEKLTNANRIVRLKEIARSSRKNKDALNCLNKYDFSLQDLATRFILENQNLFNPGAVKKIADEFNKKKLQTDIIEHLENRVQYISEIMTAFEEAIGDKRIRITTIKLVILLAIFSLMFGGGLATLILANSPGLRFLGIMISAIAGAACSNYTFLRSKESLERSLASDLSSAQNSHPNQLNNWEEIKNFLLTLIEKIQGENAIDTSLKNLAVTLNAHINAAKPKMIDILNILREIKNNYLEKISSLRNDRQVEMLPVASLAELMQCAENRELLPQAPSPAIFASSRSSASDNQESAPLLQIQNSNF